MESVSFRMVNRILLADPTLDLSWLARLCPVNALIDIGANDGSFGAYLARTFDVSNVYAFEPLVKYHSTLEQRGFEVFGCALSDHEGHATLNVSKQDSASSLLPTTELCLREYPQVQTVETITVPIRRLDNLLKPMSDTIIKIDAQGAELPILEGGQAVVSEARLVLIEQTFQPLYAGQALFNQVHAQLDALGFDLIGLRSQAVSERDGTPLFAHGIYRNRSTL